MIFFIIFLNPLFSFEMLIHDRKYTENVVEIQNVNAEQYQTKYDGKPIDAGQIKRP